MNVQYRTKHTISKRTLNTLFLGHFSDTNEGMNSIVHTIQDLVADPQVRLWIGVVVASIGLTAGLYFFAPHAQTRPSSVIADPTILAVKPGDWVRGNPETAKAILVEYSDFQCPACGVYHSILRQLESDMGADIAIVYRHFPLTAIHPNAETAARAAQAAGAQGKFFEMHDMLFTEQQTWSSEKDVANIFAGYAEKLGLDVARFKEDMDAPTTKDAVKNNMQEGTTLGLRGTPSFFLNGNSLPTTRTYAEFKTSIINTIYKQ